MSMKIRDKNPRLKELLVSLEKAGRNNKSGLWKALARSLNRPRRAGFEVNLFELSRAGGNETLVVPGRVLGSGALDKPLSVAALAFSAGAKKDIEKAGGTAMSIQDALEKSPGGKGMRIFG